MYKPVNKTQHPGHRVNTTREVPQQILVCDSTSKHLSANRTLSCEAQQHTGHTEFQLRMDVFLWKPTAHDPLFQSELYWAQGFMWSTLWLTGAEHSSVSAGQTYTMVLTHKNKHSAFTQWPSSVQQTLVTCKTKTFNNPFYLRKVIWSDILQLLFGGLKNFLPWAMSIFHH